MDIQSSSARVLSNSFMALSWKVVDPVPSYAGVTVEVFRSQGSGLGERIAELPGDADRFIDRDVPTWRIWQRLRYTVRASSAEREADAAFAPGRPGDQMGLALADQLRNLLVAQMGLPCWHAPRKDFGDRCPDCYDETRGRKSQSHCVKCFDTSLVGGYGQPEMTHVSFRPSEEILEQAGIMEKGESQAVCWVANYPDLAPGDLLFETENRCWKVVKVQPFERLRTCFRQVALLDEVERDQVVYQFPYPEQSAWMSPA